MDVALFGEIEAYQRIPLGGVFRFARGDRTQLGMRVRDKDGDGAILMDSAPDVATPRFWYKNVVENRPLFYLIDAVVRASPDPRDWALRHTEPGLGDLILGSGAVFMSALANQDAWTYVNLRSGEVGDRIHPISGVIRRWSIVQMVDGDPVTLFEHGAAAAEVAQ